MISVIRDLYSLRQFKMLNCLKKNEDVRINKKKIKEQTLLKLVKRFRID